MQGFLFPQNKEGVNMEEQKIIYMDIESYEQYIEDIDKLIEQKKTLTKKKNEVHKSGTDVAWDNAEYLNLESECERLSVEIQRRRLNLGNIVILKHQNNNQIVDLGDVLRLNIIDQYGNDEIIGRLVGDAKPNQDSEYLDISVNSLIGRLIYGKKIQETISYETNGVTCCVQIKEKLNIQKEEQKTGTVKKLEKKTNKDN